MTSRYVLYDAYSEPWHIQNPVYYRKFRHLGHIVAYLEPCVILLYSESYDIQIPDKFRTQIYSELCQRILWHIQNAV